MFLPGALAAKFLIPRISFVRKAEGIWHLVLVCSSILIAEFLFLMLANMLIGSIRKAFFIPEVLVNPIFVAAFVVLLVAGDRFLDRYLAGKYPLKETALVFNSDRRKVSLMPSEILYLESNDTEVWLYATEGRKYRNHTGIAQWESLLGDGFIRIHRSYLVNRQAIDGVGNDTVSVGGVELPISRKYRTKVRELLGS